MREDRKSRHTGKACFARNRNKKSEYIILLTTDCSISDSEVIRIYGGRWSIEVFFRGKISLPPTSSLPKNPCCALAKYSKGSAMT